MRVCDELDFSFGWIHPSPAWMERAGHAVRSDGGVWTIDPPSGPGVVDRIRALGEPRGVVQLLDRHARDAKGFADALGVPLHVVPAGPIPGAPFEIVPVVNTPRWREVALWFPRERTLCCADGLAAGPGYCAPGERVGIHPLLRLTPPRQLQRFDVQHLLLAHGEGVHGEEAGSAIDAAFSGRLRTLPSYNLALVRRLLAR